jgi:hypothetical protein
LAHPVASARSTDLEKLAFSARSTRRLDRCERDTTGPAGLE